MSDSRSKFFLSHGADANIVHLPCGHLVKRSAFKCEKKKSPVLSESSPLREHFLWSLKYRCDLRMLDLKGTKEIICMFLRLEMRKVEPRRWCDLTMAQRLVWDRTSAGTQTSYLLTQGPPCQHAVSHHWWGSARHTAISFVINYNQQQ